MKRPKNYIIVEDIFSQGYVGGEGDRIFTKNEFKSAVSENTLGKTGPSIIAVPTSEEPKGDVHAAPKGVVPATAYNIAALTDWVMNAYVMGQQEVSQVLAEALGHINVVKTSQEQSDEAVPPGIKHYLFVVSDGELPASDSATNAHEASQCAADVAATAWVLVSDLGGMHKSAAGHGSAHGAALSLCGAEQWSPECAAVQRAACNR